MNASESLEQQASRAIESHRCACCHSRKEPGHPFCRDCFMELSEDLRECIMSRRGADLAVVMEEALEILRLSDRWKA